MPPTKSPAAAAAAAESSSVDNESATIDMDPRPGRPSTTLSVESSQTRRSSQSSLRSQPCANTPISCVSRESMSGEDGARQRSIVWAAVKRNRSSRTAASDRLRCPLVRCGKGFEYHEEMLRHLTQCQHLSTGDYYCYEGMKIEYFNDKKCTCSVGQPTKGRRIINMAKHFFSSIGSIKARQENRGLPTHNAHPCHPRYESPIVDIPEQHSEAQMNEPTRHEEIHNESQRLGHRQSRQELNGSELVELDSTPLLPMAELDAVNHNAHRTTMLDPLASCTDLRETVLSPVPSRISKPCQSQGFSAPNIGTSVGGGRRPSLALDTQVDHYRTKPPATYLSPNLSLQSSAHGISPITPWSATSASSVMWSAASNREAMLASPITPLSANVPTAVLQEDYITSTEKDMDMPMCPEDFDCYKPGGAPELYGGAQLPSAIPRPLSDPNMFSYDPEVNFSWLSSINSGISLSPSVNMMFSDPNTKTASPPDFLGPQITGSEARELVGHVWDTLNECLSESAPKLSRIQHNSLAANFRTQTPGAVALAGLTRFQKMLNQNHITQQEPHEYLCFVHLMYSISLARPEDNFATRSNELYEQAMSYGVLFDTGYRNEYCEVVRAIWQQNPQGSVSRRRFGEAANRPIGNKGKEPDYRASPITIAKPDPLINIGQNFLDEFEYMTESRIRQPMEVIRSDIWHSHLVPNQPALPALRIASEYLISQLCHLYQDSENLLQKLRVVANNARAGYYATIRRLELELIQTGKNCLPSNDFLDQYIVQVRSRCDQIFTQSGTRSRVAHYLDGISQVDSLIRSAAREPQQPQQGQSEYPLIPYTPCEDNFLPVLNGWDMMIPSTQAPFSSFGSDPQLSLGPLHPVVEAPQLVNGSPNAFPLRSNASETPSETYTVSPPPLSDVPPEQSNSYRPTPPFQLQREGGEASGSSTLASSGQKVEANEPCDICGYRPKGDPQWFKGSMAKHKKMQHSTNPPVIYKCPFPGCNSEYKNRRDNLRQHQIEKGHFVGDETMPRTTNKRKRRQ
ncbi:putative zinc finger protein [Rosellinia necatrix]|uniref:Putative zinc finger protein n=1 Tax=Rosellinia necatrix TaxID=77044 RepID=A0A1S7UHF8_ROSNE|nr:putative zinc finger protein [Rosellinia necatrix]